MKARSLHLRLMVGAAVAILAALAVAWLAMTWLFERHIERREAAELRRSAMVLISGLRTGAGGLVAETQPSDPRFGVPAGGHYWQATGPGAAVRSRSLWDQGLPAPPVAPSDDWDARVGAGPFGAHLLYVERSVRLDRGGPPILVQVATDDAALGVARREFGRDLALFLAVLWAVLSAAALAQVRLGLQPLNGLRGELERLRRSPSARLTVGAPREIEPLVEAINALAEARETDLERARRRAADLAHSLKTPLAALSAQSRLARDAGAATAADGLDRAIAAVGAALETELARARAAAAREGSKDQLAAPAVIVERLLGVIERTEDGAKRVFDTDLPPDLRLPVAPEVLTEILGALIENASRYAHRQVRIAGADGGLTIEDDGPGIDEGRAAGALIRGGRLDEAGPGHGLGLAIVRDLVEATEGEIALGRSTMGGLKVTLSWTRS